MIARLEQLAEIIEISTNNNYRQMIGTCQIGFSGTKSQAIYQLKKNLGYFNNCNDYKISFKNSTFIHKVQ